MLRYALFIAALSTASTVQAKPIYQCQDGSGQPVFSDKPCGRDAKEIEVRQPSVIAAPKRKVDNSLFDEPVTATTRSRAASAQDCPSAAAIDQAIFRRQIVQCMTEAQVDKAVKPGLRDSYRASSGADEQGPYLARYYSERSEGWPRYILFRRGQVASFHDAEPPEASCRPHCGQGYRLPRERQGVPAHPVHPNPHAPRQAPSPRPDANTPRLTPREWERERAQQDRAREQERRERHRRPES